MKSKSRIIDYYTRNPITEFYDGKQLEDNDPYIITSVDIEELIVAEMIEKIERFYCVECDEEVYPTDDQCYCDRCEEEISRDGFEIRSTYIVKQSAIREAIFDKKKLEKSIKNPEIAGELVTILELEKVIEPVETIDAIAITFENIDDLHIMNNQNIISVGYGEQIIVIKSEKNKIEIRGKESYLYSLIIRDLTFLFDCESIKKKMMIRYLPGYNNIDMELDLLEYIPNLDKLVDRQRLEIRSNLHTAIYMLKCKIDLPDKTFLVFNALRGLESIIKLIAAKYNIHYGNTLQMFTVEDEHVKLTTDCIKRLGDPNKISVYKRLYQMYRKQRNSYFHWDKLLFNKFEDTTNTIKDEKKAIRIITKILELINEACEVM